MRENKILIETLQGKLHLQQRGSCKLQKNHNRINYLTKRTLLNKMDNNLKF